MRWPSASLFALLLGCSAGAPPAAASPSGSSAPPSLPLGVTAASSTPKQSPPAAPRGSSSAASAPAASSVPSPSTSPSSSAASLNGLSPTGSPASAPGPGVTTSGGSNGTDACPSGMILVDGDYCTEVEQKCLQWWYDKSNKKKVCEVFEPSTRCVGQKVKKRFCMDRYTWPNQAGERPEVMNRFHQAEVKCAAIGKRLCTETEWTMACEGPEMKPFPYGYVRDSRKCNGDHEWDEPNMTKVAERDAHELGRLWKGVRNGAQPACVSDFGVPDLSGNVDEVTSSETFSSDFRGKYDSVHSGGPWYKGVRNQCRPKIYTHDEGFYYYFLGFRCCAEPDGKETDPRTLRQQKEHWDFSKVEKIAGTTRQEVKDALALKKKQGNCGCASSKNKTAKNRCNTLCGTLLGPNAVDAQLPDPSGPPPQFSEDKVSPVVLEKALKAGEKKPSR